MANIQPLRPYMLFTDGNGNLTKDAYDFLFNMYQRVGGSLSALNAASLQDHTWQEPGTIGSITPTTGKFTTLTATTGVATVSLTVSGTGTFSQPPNFNGGFNVTPNTVGTVTIKPTGYTGSIDNMNIGTTVPATGKFNQLQSTGYFGCNGASPQAAVYLSGPVSTTASTNTSPYGFTTAAQADDIVAKLNTIISALTANGILRNV